jgi:hypothetical protein
MLEGARPCSRRGVPSPDRLTDTGRSFVGTNKWDPELLCCYLEDPIMTTVAGPLDGAGTREQIEHAATLLPAEWLAPSATGSPVRWVAAIRAQLALGCDGVILHGCTPEELRPVATYYRATS